MIKFLEIVVILLVMIIFQSLLWLGFYSYPFGWFTGWDESTMKIYFSTVAAFSIGGTLWVYLNQKTH